MEYLFLPPIPGMIIPAAIPSVRSIPKDKTTLSKWRSCFHILLGLLLAASIGLVLGALTHSQFSVLRWLFTGTIVFISGIALLFYYVKPAKSSEDVVVLIDKLWTYSQDNQIHRHLPKQMALAWLTKNGIYFKNKTYKEWVAFETFNIETISSGYYIVELSQRTIDVIFSKIKALSVCFLISASILFMLIGGVWGYAHLGLRDDVLAALSAGTFILLASLEVALMTGSLRKNRRSSLLIYVSSKDISLERLEEFIAEKFRKQF